MKVLALFGLAVGCVKTSSVICEDGRLCPSGTSCDDARQLCLTRAQTEVCATISDGQPCDAAGTRGICDRGLCEPGCGDSFVDPDEQCDDGNFASHDGCSSACNVELPAWNQIPPRWRGATLQVAAYHAGLHRIVMIGGQDSTGTTAAIWQRDPSNAATASTGWHEVTAAFAPGDRPYARAEASIAYDPGRDVIVYFGGLDVGNYYFGDTWEYATSTTMFDGDPVGTWTHKTFATSPSPRCGAEMAYDGTIGKIVLYGGLTPNGANGETWTYDASGWTQLAPATSPTPSRARAGMVFDSVRDRLVLFGGANSTTTWEFDGATWAQIPQTTFPPPRRSPAMAFDATQGVSVLFGGSEGTSVLGDGWTYDGTWHQLTNAITPPGRRGAVLVADPVNASVVLVGGAQGDLSVPLTDQWLFSSDGWALDSPRFEPPGAIYAAGAYDPDLHTLFVFGGADALRLGESELWGYEGHRWQQHANAPVARAGHSMAYDPVHRRLLVFGGACDSECVPGTGVDVSDQTFAYDPATDTWTQLMYTAPSGLARTSAVMVYDEDTGEIVVFGGQDTSGTASALDTWTFDGTTWTRHDGAPEATAGGWDPVLHSVIALEVSGEIAQYSNGQWTTLVAAGTGPVARTSAGLSYSVERARFVLVGGYNEAGKLLYDQWELDTSARTWTQLFTPSATPLPRHDMVLAPQTRERVLVLYSGVIGTAAPAGDSWTLHYESTTPDEVCGDAIDNDGDQQVDDADPDCNPPP